MLDIFLRTLEIEGTFSLIYSILYIIAGLFSSDILVKNVCYCLHVCSFLQVWKDWGWTHVRLNQLDTGTHCCSSVETVKINSLQQPIGMMIGPLMSYKHNLGQDK